VDVELIREYTRFSLMMKLKFALWLLEGRYLGSLMVTVNLTLLENVILYHKKLIIGFERKVYSSSLTFRQVKKVFSQNRKNLVTTFKGKFMKFCLNSSMCFQKLKRENLPKNRESNNWGSSKGYGINLLSLTTNRFLIWIPKFPLDSNTNSFR